ncbi:MAG: hypothetical protein ABIG93_05685 [archaeon]|nr:hypothetical protein [Nanoarchaeota archaeon]
MAKAKKREVKDAKKVSKVNSKSIKVDKSRSAMKNQKKNKNEKSKVKDIDKLKNVTWLMKDHKKPKTFWEKVEHYNARLIPFALALLLIIVILELAYHNENHAYELSLMIADYLIIAIFVVDLIFIAKKCNTTMYFFKNYWLDILAVFPFMLFFNLINSIRAIFLLSREVGVGQAIFHETLEIRKGIAVASRTGKFAKFLKFGARMLRLLTKSRFGKKMNHHKNREKKKSKVKKNSSKKIKKTNKN